MTDLPLVPGVIKIQPHWTYGTDANVMSHIFLSFGGPGTPSTNDLTALATLFQSNYNSNMASLVHNSVTLRQVVATFLGDRTSALGIWNGTVLGQKTGQPVPASTCMLFNLHISRRYRGGKPRLYWPLGNGGDIADPQHWGSGILNNSQTAINALKTALEAFSGSTVTSPAWCTVSYYHGGALRPTPLVDIVTSISPNSIPGSQRRRIRP